MIKKIETRSQTIMRHLEAYQRGTGTSWPTIAQDIAEEYMVAVPHLKQTIQFRRPDKKDPYRAMRANAQILTRFRDGTNRLPCDLEEAIIEALPHPWDDELTKELLMRQGLLMVYAPTGDQTEDVQSASLLLKETGEAMQALAPMLDNGKFGPEDKQHAYGALTQLDDVIAAVCTIKQAINEKVMHGDNLYELPVKHCKLSEV